MIGFWMLMTLVLTKSYAGNLMSMLAVRYSPQPFQTLRNVLNHPHVSMIWQKYSRNEQFLKVKRNKRDLDACQWLSLKPETHYEAFSLTSSLHINERQIQDTSSIQLCTIL